MTYDDHDGSYLDVSLENDGVMRSDNDNEADNDDDDGVTEHETHDYISMTQAVFAQDSQTAAATRWVLVVYYVNLVLVLGDYVLVMSHAVRAMLGSRLCLPNAGLLAATLMFGIAQFNDTMALLGRTTSIVSLLCLLIVVGQCLIALNTTTTTTTTHVESFQSPPSSIWTKLTALGSIGFAVGSQKLFLNIRHEMDNRTKAPYSLGMSLSFFGTVYVVVCLFAGTS